MSPHKPFIPSRNPESKYNQFRANWLAWQCSAPTGYHDGVQYFKNQLKQFPQAMIDEAKEFATKRPQHFRYAS